jgi:hypothetical protein
LIKVLGQENNPLEEILESTSKALTPKQQRRERNKRSMLYDTYKILKKKGLSKIEKTTTYLKRPVWREKKIQTDTTLHKYTKDQLNSETW